MQHLTDSEIIARIQNGISILYETTEPVDLWPLEEIKLLAQDVSDILYQDKYDHEWLWNKVSEYLVVMRMREELHRKRHRSKYRLIAPA